ncbi:uncharacterized protein LOC134222228 [Armigeres subalbatus]|uniref:uncharacterized protein LOC134222228 n=1 Tax=Armigeres subalbatus TaxID=124917 RepID=UPI002ED0CD8F
MEQIPIAVRVEKDGKRMVQSIVSVLKTTNFESIIDQVLNRKLNKTEKIDKVFAGSKSINRDDLFEVDPSTILQDAVTAIGTCTKVLCLMKPTFDPPKQPQNAFDHLMKNAAVVLYPDKKEERDGRSELYNCVVQYLVDKKAGFKRFQKTELQQFMSAFVSALWYLDGQSEKLASAPSVPQLPASFCFTPKTRDTFRMYHGREKKKTLPRMMRTDMIKLFDELDSLCATAILNSKSWLEVQSDVQMLRATYAGYINYLNKVEDRVESQSVDHRCSLLENRSLKL